MAIFALSCSAQQIGRSKMAAAGGIACSFRTRELRDLTAQSIDCRRFTAAVASVKGCPALGTLAAYSTFATLAAQALDRGARAHEVSGPALRAGSNQ